ncbi:putative defensin-like protein [Cardamine amara subsp. amara]|uniref:Defensin-like protein n=1 Tax=Cardamine amara subsp. amara TaxID=228776 RepID=A0ABD1C1H7_CARAN
MERITSLVFLVSLLIIFASVVNQTRAGTCDESLGICQGCDDRCKAKHGPSCISKCDGEVGNLMCTCTYDCTPPPPLKTCNNGLGMCSPSCPECCNAQCAQKYVGGSGLCNTLDNISMCLCKYPC